jgi:hypothetical protein
MNDDENPTDEESDRSMKSSVWHVKREMFRRWLEGGVELRFPLDYECVAMVESDDLDEVFQLTNTIDRPWWENEGVEVRKQTRSTSVGDVVILPDNQSVCLCLPVGWKVYHGAPQRFPSNLYDLVEKKHGDEDAREDQ